LDLPISTPSMRQNGTTDTRSRRALQLVRLIPLMERTSGTRDLTVAVIDGPVADHPDLTTASAGQAHAQRPTCAEPASPACRHGTFVAGVLFARRGSPAPAICPGCSFLIRPIFQEDDRPLASATDEELARALLETIDAGARVVNLSLGLSLSSGNGTRKVEQALDLAARNGVLVVAAAGNQGLVGGTAITGHPWVIPVVSCALDGRVSAMSNLGASMGRRGLGAPGSEITSLSTTGLVTTMGGTSVAAPFVTGTIALLWSEFPDVPAATLKHYLTSGHLSRRRTVVPPLLDAWGTYLLMASAARRWRTHRSDVGPALWGGS
jgi:subtilisin family serine protease